MKDSQQYSSKPKVDSPDHSWITVTADLLGVDPEVLRRALTTRTRIMPSGSITSPLSVRAAEDSRDSLAKVTLLMKL